MKKLLVATRNKGKMKEIRGLLAQLVEELSSLHDFTEIPETVEDGATFADNALKKAREACKATGLPALADDSGLIVSGLQGRPGVLSARYAGKDADDTANNLKLLSELKDLKDSDRKASFISVIAFVTTDGKEQLFEGRVDGVIVDTPAGENGFGYDPHFLVNGYNQTMAELSLEEKNRISHRGKALKAFCSFIYGG